MVTGTRPGLMMVGCPPDEDIGPSRYPVRYEEVRS
jgi:hypothetical protein